MSLCCCSRSYTRARRSSATRGTRAELPKASDTDWQGRTNARMYLEGAFSGLGESLVGNVPGQPLAVSINTRDLCEAAGEAARSDSERAPELQCAQFCEAANEHLALHAWVDTWPHHSRASARCARSSLRPRRARRGWCGRLALRTEQSGADGQSGSASAFGMIARSASNMEDLADYAGAGVFDSYPTRGSVYLPAEAGPWGGSFAEVGKQIVVMALAAAEAQVCLGGEQDVEGVCSIRTVRVVIVQARPQV